MTTGAKLLTVKEVAEMSGLAEWRIYEILKEPDGPRVNRFGRAIRVPESEWHAWQVRNMEKLRPAAGRA